ncbi:MAG: DUF47 family protein [Pirellulales bacterium]
MFSLQKLLSKDNKFFDLLEASAGETVELTRLLIQLLKNRSHSQPLNDFASARGHDKLITDQISKELVNTFVTGLEREDIEMLSYALYRTCKTIEKFAERYNLAPQRLVDVDFSKQTALVEQATTTVSEMIKTLRKSPSLETMKGLNDKMQLIESEADDVVLQLLGGVYNGKYDPIQAMFVRDLHDLLEKVIDRCRDAANAVTHIVMKNS